MVTLANSQRNRGITEPITTGTSYLHLVNQKDELFQKEGDDNENDVAFFGITMMVSWIQMMMDWLEDIGNMGHNGGLNALMGSWAKLATCKIHQQHSDGEEDL